MVFCFFRHISFFFFSPKNDKNASSLRFFQLSFPFLFQLLQVDIIVLIICFYSELSTVSTGFSTEKFLKTSSIIQLFEYLCQFE